MTIAAPTIAISMRGKAVLKRSAKLLGVYTKDVSRQGVAFLSPVPLLPKERVKLQLPAIELSLEVTRCRRIEAACFECGGKFAYESKFRIETLKDAYRGYDW